jgi:hypothetical protein
MPATATRTKSPLKSANAAEVVVPEIGEDGFPVKRWLVNGVEQVFSLRPYREEEKVVYWNPIYPGQTMLWRAPYVNEFGIQPVIQREAWVDGRFAPRNDWERFMTEEYLKTLPGGRPDQWQGYNHPDNEPGELPNLWRCGDCAWVCGNSKAFRAHQQYLRHREATSFD